MYIETHGQGKPLILLHGWGMNSLVWQPLLPLLEQHYCVYLVDLPGFGHSQEVDDDPLGAFCDWAHTHLPVDAHWLGWSMGGLYLLEFARRYPEHPRSLCLMASNPKFVATEGWAGVEQAVFDQFAALLSEDIHATIERFLAIQAMGAPQARGQIKKLKQQLMLAPTATENALQQGLALLKSSDLRHVLAQTALPVSVVLGERDKLVPSDVLPQLKTLNETIDTITITSAGHAPFVSSPELVAEPLIRWWQGINESL